LRTNINEKEYIEYEFGERNQRSLRRAIPSLKCSVADAKNVCIKWTKTMGIVYDKKVQMGIKSKMYRRVMI